ncbi:MAG: LCP family protein, partial [Lachnospiraceae bacterium]|nr:LCP family protein [Lachnospiraceae bacterium]
MSRKVVSRSEFIIKRLLIILGCIISVLVILVAVAKIVTIIGRNKLEKNANTQGPVMTDDARSSEKIEGIYESDWQEGWISFNDKIYEYNKDIRTFLVLGIDDAHQGGDSKYFEMTDGGQSDGIFLVILNPHDKTIKVMAVNRDTQVDVLMVGVGEDGKDIVAKSQITNQHAFGGGGEYSCELTRDAVSKLLYEIPIHGYVAVNYKAIPAINDSVGGVTLTLPEDMDVTEINKKWTPGSQITLMGKDAYNFVHYRNVDVFESQRSRLARQKLYLKNFINQTKAKTKEDITLPVTIFNKIKNDVVTDLTVDSIS